jgi:DNA primase
MAMLQDKKRHLRAFSDDQKFVTQTFVAVEPDGLDPCDLRQTKGDAALTRFDCTTCSAL